VLQVLALVLAFNPKLPWSCPGPVRRVSGSCPALVPVPLERGFVPVSASEHPERESHRVPGPAVLAAVDSPHGVQPRSPECIAGRMAAHLVFHAARLASSNGVKGSSARSGGRTVYERESAG
jgi:hypothetical protein